MLAKVDLLVFALAIVCHVEIGSMSPVSDGHSEPHPDPSQRNSATTQLDTPVREQATTDNQAHSSEVSHSIELKKLLNAIIDKEGKIAHENKGKDASAQAGLHALEDKDFSKETKLFEILNRETFHVKTTDWQILANILLVLQFLPEANLYSEWYYELEYEMRENVTKKEEAAKEFLKNMYKPESLLIIIRELWSEIQEPKENIRTRDFSEKVEKYLDLLWIAYTIDSIRQFIPAFELPTVLNKLDVIQNGHSTDHWELKYTLMRQRFHAIEKQSDFEALVILKTCSDLETPKQCAEIPTTIESEIWNAFADRTEEEREKQEHEDMQLSFNIMGHMKGHMERVKMQPEWFSRIVITVCLLDEAPSINTKVKLLRDHPMVIQGKIGALDELLKQTILDKSTKLSLQACKLREIFKRKENTAELTHSLLDTVKSAEEEGVGLNDRTQQLLAGVHKLLQSANALTMAHKPYFDKYTATAAAMHDIYKKLPKYINCYINENVAAVFSSLGDQRKEPLRRFLLVLTNLNYPDHSDEINTAKIMETRVMPQAARNIAILGHIILRKDILHDVVMEVYGKTGNAVLEQRLEYYDSKLAKTPGFSTSQVIGHQLIELQMSLSHEKHDQPALRKLFEVVNPHHAQQWIPLVMQSGFVALKRQLNTVPEEMAAFFAICEKNSSIQANLLKEWNDEEKLTLTISAVLRDAFSYNHEHSSKKEEAIRTFYIFMTNEFEHKNLLKEFVYIIFPIIDSAIQQSSFLSGDIKFLANTDILEQKRKIILGAYPNYVDKIYGNLFYDPRVILRYQVLVATQLIQLQDLLKAERGHADIGILVKQIETALVASYAHLTHHLTAVQCGLSDLQPILLEHKMDAKILHRLTQTCSYYEEFRTQRIAGKSWDEIMGPLITKAAFSADAESLKKLFLAVHECSNQIDNLEDPNIVFGILAVSKSAEYLANKETEWAWIRITLRLSLEKAEKGLKEVFWNQKLETIPALINGFGTKFNEQKDHAVAENDEFCREWYNLLSDLEFILKCNFVRGTSYFIFRHDLQITLLKGDLKVMTRCAHKKFVIEQNFRVEFMTSIDRRSLPESLSAELAEKAKELSQEIKETMGHVSNQLVEVNELLRNLRSFEAYRKYLKLGDEKAHISDITQNINELSSKVQGIVALGKEE